MARTPALPPMPPGVPQRNAQGHFMPGNGFAIGSKGGANRTKIFHDGDELMSAFREYAAYVDANPYLLPKQAQYKGRPVDLNDRQMKAYTVTAFLDFHGVYLRRWSEWKSPGEKHRADLAEAIEQIEALIDDHVFRGGMSGVLNAIFAARALKLAERTELVGGGSGAPPVAFTLAPIQTGTFLPPDAGEMFAVPSVVKERAPTPSVQPLAPVPSEPECKKAAPPVHTDPAFRPAQEQRYQWNEETQRMELVDDDIA